MNYQIIPEPKKIIINEKTESPVIREEELSLSEELKKYVKKAEEVCPFHGEKAIVLAMEPDFEMEEYRLDITAEQVTVQASAPQGAYYALVTLMQLFHLNNGEMTAVTICDKPSMPLRGISDDIARGQISTLDNFKDIVRRMSYVKCNVYMPYLEDTFVFKKYPESGKFSDPVPQEEWKELIAYAKDYYIAVIPVFNTIGHWDKNARLSYFNPYVIKANDEADGIPCTSVDVRKPEAQQMIFDMLDELVDVFGEAGAVHVGGDEVGDYTSLFKKEKAGEYYNEHFNRVYDYLKKKGIKTFMYSDMYTPLYGDYSLGIDYIDQMPEDMNFVFWDYACRADYPNIRNLVERKKKFYLSPATMTWNRMLPHHYVSWLNTKLLAEHGHENASGIIMSAWCDGGMSLREENWFGIYAGALYSWNCDTVYTFEEFVKSYYQLFFGIDVDMEQYQRLMNYDYHFVSHPYDPEAYEGRIEFWYDKWQNGGSRFFQEFWKDATLPADAQLQEKLQGSEQIFEEGYAYFSGLEVKRNRQAYEAFLFDIKRSAVAARKVAMLTDKPYHSREEAMQMIPAIDRMIEELTGLLEENKVQWFACNRNSEWDYLEAKYMDLIESFRSLKRYCRCGKSLGEIKRV